MSQFKNLPLQEMIRSVVSNATEKLAADQGADAQVRAAMGGAPAPEPEEIDEDGTAITDPGYVEKLASACDFIAENVNHIEAPNRGVLGAAIAKMAGEDMPPAVPTPEQLSVQAAMGGKQKYKHDKPKGEDAAASTANTPEGTAGLAGGATQMQNDMDKAPGGNNSSVPTKAYPEKGPLVSGPTKTASGLAALANSLVDKTAAEYGEAQKEEHKRIARGAGKATGTLYGAGGAAMGGTAAHEAISRAASRKAPSGKMGKALKALGKTRAGRIAGTAGAALAAGGAAGLAGGGLGYGMSRGSNRVYRAMGGEGKEKSAGELAREKILAKLAGEDVMKASTSAGKSGGPLVGDGELDALKAENTPSSPTDGSGYGNQQRGMVGSNEAATNYTKGDAKKPRAKELKEVLDTPAFDPGADSKLREQLRNSGSAGVKIAGANSKEIIKQAAAEGRLTQETVNQFKELRKQAQMGAMGAAPDAAGGGGMTAMAGEPPQNPKVQKLKEMMQAKKGKESMADNVPGGQVPPPA